MSGTPILGFFLLLRGGGAFHESSPAPSAIWGLFTSTGHDATAERHDGPVRLSRGPADGGRAIGDGPADGGRSKAAELGRLRASIAKKGCVAQGERASLETDNNNKNNNNSGGPAIGTVGGVCRFVWSGVGGWSVLIQSQFSRNRSPHELWLWTAPTLCARGQSVALGCTEIWRREHPRKRSRS